MIHQLPRTPHNSSELGLEDCSFRIQLRTRCLSGYSFESSIPTQAPLAFRQRSSSLSTCRASSGSWRPFFQGAWETVNLLWSIWLPIVQWLNSIRETKRFESTIWNDGSTCKSVNKMPASKPTTQTIMVAPSPRARWKTGNQCWALTSAESKNQTRLVAAVWRSCSAESKGRTIFFLCQPKIGS